MTYKPGQTNFYRLSRTQIELFYNCPRCFWLRHRLDIRSPSLPGFLLNLAVDTLLKKEFDTYRKKGEPHPIMVKAGLKAVPCNHKDIDTWRNTFKGIVYKDEDHKFHLFGGVDDVWETEKGQLIVVDYKATAKDKEITDLDPPGSWHDSYRRQLEIYQWLFAKNGHKVFPTAYIVYANGKLSAKKFGDKLSFQTTIISHKVETDWVEEIIPKIKECLEGEMPAMGEKCEHCQYAKQRVSLFIKNTKS